MSPLEIKVAQEKYFIKVVKDKFYSFEEEVFVEQGKMMTVEANLVRQVGRIVLETTPPGAKAYIGKVTVQELINELNELPEKEKQKQVTIKMWFIQHKNTIYSVPFDVAEREEINIFIHANKVTLDCDRN